MTDHQVEPSSVALRLSLPSRLDALETADARLSQVCADLGELATAHIVAAFHEAFLEIVEHAHAGPDAELELVVARDARQVVIELVHGGEAVPMRPAPRAPIDPLALSRREMVELIISRTMNDVHYATREAGQNVLSMTYCRQRTKVQVEEQLTSAELSGQTIGSGPEGRTEEKTS